MGSFPRSHSNTVNSVGLLWTSDQLDAETCTWQHSQETDTHAPGGIRTRNPSKQAAADLHLRPRGHWDRRFIMYRQVHSVDIGLWLVSGKKEIRTGICCERFEICLWKWRFKFEGNVWENFKKILKYITVYAYRKQHLEGHPCDTANIRSKFWRVEMINGHSMWHNPAVMIKMGRYFYGKNRVEKARNRLNAESIVTA